MNKKYINNFNFKITNTILKISAKLILKKKQKSKIFAHRNFNKKLKLIIVG